eukprot:15452621-Alexandrium_andersonii.AAC.1
MAAQRIATVAEEPCREQLPASYCKFARVPAISCATLPGGFPLGPPGKATQTPSGCACRKGLQPCMSTTHVYVCICDRSGLNSSRVRAGSVFGRQLRAAGMGVGGVSAGHPNPPELLCGSGWLGCLALMPAIPMPAAAAPAYPAHLYQLCTAFAIHCQFGYRKKCSTASTSARRRKLQEPAQPC